MIDSDSSSEEEICQEMTKLDLDKITKPWDTAAAVCGNIQISGHLHIEHLRCGEHLENHDEYEYEYREDEYDDDEDGEDEDDDSDIHE